MNIEEKSAICDLIVSPNSEYVAYKLPHYYDKILFVRHVDTGYKFVLKSDFSPGKIMCFSPCSNYLITSKNEAQERKFFIWDFHFNKIIYKLGGLPDNPIEHKIDNIQDIWGHINWNNSKIICSCYDTIKVFREDEIPGLSKLNLIKFICFILEKTELVDSTLFEVIKMFL